jgi:hypothetical protein
MANGNRSDREAHSNGTEKHSTGPHIHSRRTPGGHSDDDPIYKWTVMVYFASDDPGQYGIDNLNKLKAAGSTPDVAILAQVDPTGTGQTARYWLNRGSKLDDDIVSRFSSIDTGSPDALVQFVGWAADVAPAERYILILWGHGDGWQNEDNAGRAAGRTVHRRFDTGELKKLLQVSGASNDKVDKFLENVVLLPNRTVVGSRSADLLDGQGLKKALGGVAERLGRKIDVLGMDSCLMAMVEVAYQVRDSVEYMIASEDATPLASWPFDAIFEELVNYPDLDPVQLGQIAVRQYIIDFQEQGLFVTQSVCDLGQIRSLSDAVAQLASALIHDLHDPELRATIITARAMVQSFYVKDYVDLYDYCDILGTLVSEPDHRLSRACKHVKHVITSGTGSIGGPGSFVRVHGIYGYPLKDAHGASVYFPCSDFSAQYLSLDFAKDTGWGDFAKTFASQVTSGPVRRTPQEEGTVAPTNLGAAAGDPELGPGDPILIPADPLGPHPKWVTGQRSRSRWSSGPLGEDDSPALADQ